MKRPKEFSKGVLSCYIAYMWISQPSVFLDTSKENCFCCVVQLASLLESDVYEIIALELEHSKSYKSGCSCMLLFLVFFYKSLPLPFPFPSSLPLPSKPFCIEVILANNTLSKQPQRRSIDSLVCFSPTSLMMPVAVKQEEGIIEFNIWHILNREHLPSQKWDIWVIFPKLLLS